MNMKNTLVSIMGLTAMIAAFSLPTVYAESTANETSIHQKAENIEASVHDAWLKGKLEATLLFNEDLNSFAIETEVRNGVATLSGVVESDIDRDLAGEIARSVEGVTEVDNRLMVDQSKAHERYASAENEEHRGFQQAVKDATLTAKVKTKLLVNENTGGLAIDVDSNNGAVTLTGVVDSEEEKQLAAQIAKNTGGVKAVSDRLTVVAVAKN